MKRARFSDEQIVRILQEADRSPIAEVAKLMMDAGLIVMTKLISPFKRQRQMAKQLIGEGNLIEEFIVAPLGGV